MGEGNKRGLERKGGYPDGSGGDGKRADGRYMEGTKLGGWEGRVGEGSGVKYDAVHVLNIQICSHCSVYCLDESFPD